ncbi:hypothetical protein ACHAWF_016058 [Thalassiosira exigua]
MENGGNNKVNAIFEARLSTAKPTTAASGPVRERFIRDKYERRKFYDPAAFERVSQMEASREREEVVTGVQRRLAGSASRKPSDAARRRAEEKARGRNGGVGSNHGSVRAVRAPAPAREPAPVADLLDFGNFDSPEAAQGVQASVSFSGGKKGAPSPPKGGGGVPPPPPPAADPALDLFANGGSGPPPPVGAAPSTPVAEQPKRMSNADIMNMFNTPGSQHNPMQQNMFAMQNGAGGGIAMGGKAMGGMNASGMAMMGQQMNPQQQMGMMNNMQQAMQMQGMMGGQAIGNNMGNMMVPAGAGGSGNMGGSMNMGMIGQQQMGIGGSMTNNMGMNMMQQQPQMAGGMMMQGGGGMMQQGGNQFGDQPMGVPAQINPQQQSRGGGAQGNQFAEFGNFGR